MNDDELTEEILAAELGQNPEVWWRWQNCEPDIDDDLAGLGVRGFLQLGAFSPHAQHAFMELPGFQDELDRRDYWAGWLSRDVANGVAFTRDDSDEWHWDPSRPVAGQYEEWLAHMARGDAMLDEAMGFAAEDTASREPWRATEETQESGDLETRLRAAADEFMDGIGTVVPEGAA